MHICAYLTSNWSYLLLRMFGSWWNSPCRKLNLTDSIQFEIKSDFSSTIKPFVMHPGNGVLGVCIVHWSITSWSYLVSMHMLILCFKVYTMTSSESNWMATTRNHEMHFHAIKIPLLICWKSFTYERINLWNASRFL